MIRAFYNDTDAYCCAWLSNLMDAGLITPGAISDKSIHDLTPDDVAGFTRVHAFAGIAGWDFALKLAAWPDDRPVWTGSCPCQPFSAAGKGKASGDERHLWPEWFRLIRAIRPPVIFGEQVEAAIGWGWLDLVHSDMEAEGYAIRAAVLPACSVGAPHIRQRLWFVADSDGGDASAERLQRGGEHGCKPQDGGIESLADTDDFDRRAECEIEAYWRHELGRSGNLNPWSNSLVGNADSTGRQERAWLAGDDAAPARPPGRQTTIESSPWSDLIWLPCTDGKQRPTQSGLFPLAHGVSGGRVAKLRAAGNAIIPQVAAEFIKATM